MTTSNRIPLATVIGTDKIDKGRETNQSTGDHSVSLWIYMYFLDTFQTPKMAVQNTSAEGKRKTQAIIIHKKVTSEQIAPETTKLEKRLKESVKK